MDGQTSILSFIIFHPISLIGASLFSFVVLQAIYQLWLRPSSSFPGPKLAVLSFWYEFYYDVWLGGQYTWKIRELHKQYGPFVRINPYEVHCIDPDFFESLYVSSAKRRTDKWIWTLRQSWTRNSAFKTIQHDLHRQRRDQLSKFFSKSSIRNLEPLLSAKIEKLCSRLEADARAIKPINLTHAHMALTVDIISRLCFGFSYNMLDLPDYAWDWHTQFVTGLSQTHLIRHFPWVPRIVGLLPRWLTSSQATSSLRIEEQRRKEFIDCVKAVMDRHTRGEKPPDDNTPTIFDAMLDADVPASEKSLLRLSEEAQANMGAGSLTTAKALDFAVYFILKSPATMTSLARELETAMTHPSSPLSWNWKSFLVSQVCCTRQFA